MLKRPFNYAMAGLVALSVLSNSATARLYDNFNTSDNWTLIANGGTAAIGSSVLTLTSPANDVSNPSATTKVAQTLTGSRQSILVRSHTGVSGKTVFFFWATDPSTSNGLEIKLDDSNPTSTRVVCGYYSNSGKTYNFLATAAYNPGADGLYLAYRESGGMTFWEISSDASNWTEVVSLANPINTSSVNFEVQHKEYNTTTVGTSSVVDCFNYRATGVGYHSLQEKTTSGGTAWQLYTEGFHSGVSGRVCCSDSSSCSSSCNMTINGVDASQHFTDTSIPAPFVDQNGYLFQITSTLEPSTGDFYNAYRFQKLPFVDADTWTYHLYFKYYYPEHITQGLEFPINKYTGSQRLQGAVAWYPQNGTTIGMWNVWTGSGGWKPTGSTQTFQTNFWYEVTYTVGLHDGNVFYSGFKAGPANSLTSFAWNNSYAATSDGTSASIMPAMQMDDNNHDTSTATTLKNCWMAEWHIDWQDEKLP